MHQMLEDCPWDGSLDVVGPMQQRVLPALVATGSPYGSSPSPGFGKRRKYLHIEQLTN